LNEIEIWDLDLADPIQPEHVLKGHMGPLTSLSINPFRQNVMISGSADQTVRVWDINSVSLVDNISINKGEVQNLKWSPNEESHFLCHSGPNTIQLYDLKTSATATSSVNLMKSPIDSIEYSSKNPFQFFVGSEDGRISAYDIRMFSQDPVFWVQAHDKNIPGLSSAGDYLVSNSLDGKLRIWDLKQENKFEIVKEKQTPLKQLFVSSIHPENPFLFACGAEGAEVVVWDFYEEVVKGNESGGPQIAKDNELEEEKDQAQGGDLDIE
jgi:periodic tryptophan protein 1